MSLSTLLVRLIAAATALLSAAAVAAQEPPCLVVYGHGRNVGNEAENQAWDRINSVFNQYVSERFQTGGLRALPLVFKVGVTDPARAVALLVGEAQRQGCARVVDTAVFAHEATQTLVVRLRVHPLLAAAGPQPRIGDALYTSQSDFDLRRALERLDLEALAKQMVDGYLAGTARP